MMSYYEMEQNNSENLIFMEDVLRFLKFYVSYEMK